jgi:hypothetical protein
MAFKKRGKGRKSRKGGRKSRRPRRRGGRRRKSNPVMRIIKEMKDITTPITSLYSWANRWTQGTNAVTTQMIFPVLQWNDSYDIYPMHNYLQQLLNATNSSPLNKFAIGSYEAEFTLTLEIWKLPTIYIR